MIKGEFYMIEKIAMWGGVAGIIIAVFAVAILYLTRSNIIDLLDRDVVMYDKNFEIKKEALHEAFNCLDVVAQNGFDVKMNPQFIARAKQAYNGLLCTVNSSKLYQDFYRIAIDTTSEGFTIQDIERFKISCRGELISKRKKSKEGFKGSTNGALDNSFFQAPVQPASQPVQPQVQPRPQARPAQRPNPPQKPNN